MEHFLAQVGLCGITLLIIYLIRKFYEHYNSESEIIDVYKIDKEDE